MKKFFLPLGLLAICIAASVVSIAAYAGNKKVEPSTNLTTRQFNVGSFNELSSSIVDVHVTVGPATGIAVLEAPDNLINRIKVTTSNGELKVRFDDDLQFRSRDRLKCTLRVTVPYLSEIDAETASSVTVSGPMTVKGRASYDAETAASIRFDRLTVEGSCDFSAETAAKINADSIFVSDKASFSSETASSIKVAYIETATLGADAETASSVVFTAGKADMVRFDAETAGSVKAEGVAAKSGKATAETGGSVKCRVETLTSQSETGGSVKNAR